MAERRSLAGDGCHATGDSCQNFHESLVTTVEGGGSRHERRVWDTHL